MAYRPVRRDPAKQRRRLRVQSDPILLSHGFRADASPLDLPLNTAARADDVRHEKMGLRKGYTLAKLGETAIARILALGEYKYADGKEIVQRTIRIFRSPSSGLGVIERWTGSEWVRLAESDEPLAQVYLSTQNLQNAYTLADGIRIFIFVEERERLLAEYNFSGKVLSNGDLSVVNQNFIETFFAPNDPEWAVQLEEGTVVDETVIFNYSIFGDEFTIANATFVHKAEGESWAVVETKEHNPPTADGNHIVPIQIPGVKGGDEVGIFFGPVTGGTAEGHSIEWTQLLEGELDDPIVISNLAGPLIGDITVRFRVEFEGLDELTAIVHLLINDELKREIVTSYDGETDPTREFEIVIQGPLEDGDTITLRLADWEEKNNNSKVSIIGNHSYPYDDEPGISFDYEGNLLLFFEVISPDAPGGRYIFSFADRLVALQDGGDPQSLAWSASGRIRDWIGVGSGQIFLVDARADAVDDLMCGAPLGSNIAVIIRKRSIMRLFPTGNPLQALGATYWVEDIGTESPFSLQVVPGGVLFLGHNKMVYFFSEQQGLVPVGIPIHEEFKKRLRREVLHLVDSVYNQKGEYILGIPEDGSPVVTALWMLDFRRFADREEPAWVRKPQRVQRLGISSVIAPEEEY